MSRKSKVVLLPCDSYQEEKIYPLLKIGLSALGGLEHLIGKEEKILLKPNLLKKSEVEKAVITHPAVVGAMARLLREEGYEHIRCGDSCAAGDPQKIMASAGMLDVLEKYQIPAADFSQGEKTPCPNGRQAKEFLLAKEVLQADALINLSKMKTHALERITGAVKNMYGCIPGYQKAMDHTKYPTADSFARMLVDLNQLVRPRLYLMDGIMAMEGNGPGSGDPTPMNVLLLSQDPVALDSLFCRLIHVEPQKVPTNYHGEKLGLGTMRTEEISIITPDGEISTEEAVAAYGNPDFQVERKGRRQALWVQALDALRIFQKKPYIVKDRCVRCGICVKSCPVEGKAVSFKNGTAQIPVYDYKKCIRCFCCQEMCPHKAIQVKR